MKCTGEKAECAGATTLMERRPEYLGPPRRDSGEKEEGILLPRRQWRQARPPDETDSTTRKKRAQRRRERARAQELEGNNESNGWAPTTKEPKDELQAQSMKQVPIHASARRGRAEGGAEAEEA